ncbi:hypothetical protein BJ741DRAFT_307373 [Chytriomyces cf. hyalinus JEL632]|nr:hypothetical protein BJ741DRAFT_307373 [Chytriomyces cf. hyalinus JEL632]
MIPPRIAPLPRRPFRHMVQRSKYTSIQTVECFPRWTAQSSSKQANFKSIRAQHFFNMDPLNIGSGTNIIHMAPRWSFWRRFPFCWMIRLEPHSIFGGTHRMTFENTASRVKPLVRHPFFIHICANSKISIIRRVRQKLLEIWPHHRMNIENAVSLVKQVGHQQYSFRNSLRKHKASVVRRGSDKRWDTLSSSMQLAVSSTEMQ